jgi:hypothetical protein
MKLGKIPYLSFREMEFRVSGSGESGESSEGGESAARGRYRVLG